MEKLTDKLTSSVNRVHLTFTLIPLGALIVLTLLCKNLIYNATFGPFPADANYLSSVKSAWTADKYYVSIKGTGIAATPYFIAQVRHGEQPDPDSATHQIALLAVPPRLMLVKLGKDQPLSKDVTGKISYIQKDLSEIVANDVRDNPEIGQALLPVMLDASDSIASEMAFYEIVAFLLAVTAAFNGIRLVIWLNPEKHPVGKALKKFGPLREVVDLVNGEGLTAISYGTATLTNSFLFFPKPTEPVAVKLSDIVWAYNTVSENEVKKPSNLTIWTRDGKKSEILTSLKDRENLLKALNERLPHVIFDFDAKRWLTWRTKPQSLVDEVDARRRG